MKTTFVVIPAFNEGSRLMNVVAKIRSLHPRLPIVVVDDGSTSPVVISTPLTILLRHQINLGKGAALKTGIEYSFQKGADAVILMDADGQHDPKELSRFIKYLGQGYTLVFGSRSRSIDVPLMRFLGNKFASVYINLLFGIYVSDILSGFRALTKRAYQKVCWTSPRYGVETEMVARLGKHKNELKFIEFPIETIYLDKYKGVTIVDALQILINSVLWKLS